MTDAQHDFDKPTSKATAAGGTPTQPNVSAMAIASLVLGILGILTIVLCIGIIIGLAAAILGIVAYLSINKNPDQLKGKGLAITGIILGGASMLLTVVWIIVYVWFIQVAMIQISNQAQQAQVIAIERSLQVSAELYEARTGRYPPSIDVLVNDGYLAENPNDNPDMPVEFVIDEKNRDVITVPNR